MTLPLIDTATFIEIRQLIPQRLPTLVGYFINDARQQVADIQGALARNDRDSVGATAHMLKSSARQLGAQALGESAWHIERAARQQPEADLAPLVRELTRQLEPTCRSLQAMLGQA